MKIKVLGCHGSQFLNSRFCSFLINESFALEAGSITSTLSFSQQKKIKHILLTHSHLDHIKDIAFLADNIQMPHNEPINLISSQEVLDIIKAHLLNNKLWPDFTKIPDPNFPILKYCPISLNQPTAIDGLEIRIIKVNHVVPTVAYFISDQNSTLLFTADTGPSTEIWEIANNIKNLKAIFIDTAFPNNMSDIAERSKHLTPQRLHEELTKLHKTATVYSYHLKSRFENEIKNEIKKLCPQVKALRDGEIITV
jgi:ribonuclease BN (tRNA processing enzyme)